MISPMTADGAFAQHKSTDIYQIGIPTPTQATPFKRRKSQLTKSSKHHHMQEQEAVAAAS